MPEEPVSPFGDTAGNYAGETDPAAIIKYRNAQRQYEQAGKEMPPLPGIPPADPLLKGLRPNTAVVGGDDFVLHVDGLNFTATSIIVFNGGEEPTTMESPELLTTIVKPGLAGAAVTVPVHVRQGPEAEMTYETPALDFTFTAAEPEPEPEPELEAAPEPVPEPEIAEPEEPEEPEEEGRDPGPFSIERIEDHEDGINLLVPEGDFQTGDVVAIEATGNTNVNGTYEVIEVGELNIVVDNNYGLADPIEGKGRVTIVE